MDIAPRTGKPFTFTRIRNGAEASFFPGAGARIVFASNGTDTLTLPGLPVGMLVSGDAVKVAYKGTTVFRGTVATRVERQGRGTDRVEDVTVEGPWGMMARLVFRQEWAVRNPSGGTTTMSSSGLALNVAANGQPQTVAAQVYDIARYAAPKCGFTVAGADIVAGNQVLPPEEVRDITCADAIRRELRYFPQTVCRFDYSGSAPAFHAATPPAQPTAASYLATVPMTARSFTRTAHPVVGVDIATESFDLQADGRQLRSFTHDTAGVTDSVDTLHVFMPLEKGYGSSSWEKLKVNTISTDESAGYYTSITWWIKNHPALAGMTYQVGNTNGISAFGPITPAPENLPNGCVRMTDTTVGDLERFGLKAQVVRLSCPVTITTPEKEERLVLTLDYVFTNAHTHTYTRQTSSESAADETLPAGLAQAILDQRGGEVMGEEVTLRLGDAFPVLGDADVVDGQPLYLQSYEVDCYELTALLRFGRPDFLSPSDMRDLLLGFRQRAFISITAERDSAEPDDDDADDVGGVQPITSSSTTVSSIAKATIKGTGTNANAVGKITLAASDVPASGEAKMRTLILKGAGENGADKTLKVLATEDMELDPGAGVTSLNELTGDVTIEGGDGVEVEEEGQTIRISLTGDEGDDEEDADGYCNAISGDGAGGAGGNGISGFGGGWGGGDGIDNDISNWPCSSGVDEGETT
jgi:hypothetical protein